MKRPRCITLAALCLAVATSAYAQGPWGTGDSRMPDYTQLIDQLTAQGQAMLADPTLDPAARQMLTNSLNQLRAVRRESLTPPDPSNRFEGTQYMDMYFEAVKRGFHVNSTTGGDHNAGSLHPKGRAIDVRTYDKAGGEISQLNLDLMKKGYRVRDEQTHPPGQKKWDGPHMHYSAPPRNQRDYSLGADTSLRNRPYDFRPAPRAPESNLDRSLREDAESRRTPPLTLLRGNASQ